MTTFELGRFGDRALPAAMTHDSVLVLRAFPFGRNRPAQADKVVRSSPAPERDHRSSESLPPVRGSTERRIQAVGFSCRSTSDNCRAISYFARYPVIARKEVDNLSMRDEPSRLHQFVYTYTYDDEQHWHEYPAESPHVGPSRV